MVADVAKYVCGLRDNTARMIVPFPTPDGPEKTRNSPRFNGGVVVGVTFSLTTIIYHTKFES